MLTQQPGGQLQRHHKYKNTTKQQRQQIKTRTKAGQKWRKGNEVNNNNSEGHFSKYIFIRYSDIRIV